MKFDRRVINSLVSSRHTRDCYAPVWIFSGPATVYETVFAPELRTSIDGKEVCRARITRVRVLSSSLFPYILSLATFLIFFLSSKVANKTDLPLEKNSLTYAFSRNPESNVIRSTRQHVIRSNHEVHARFTRTTADNLHDYRIKKRARWWVGMVSSAARAYKFRLITGIDYLGRRMDAWKFEIIMYDI